MRAQAARVPAQGAGAGGAAVPELRRGSTAPSRGAGRAAVFLALPPRSGVRLPDGKTAGIGGGGGRKLEQQKGPAVCLTLLSAGSWAGWVAWGGEKGRGGGGEREGSPSVV